MHCQACDKEVAPYSDLQGDMRVLYVCPTCNIPIGVADRDAPPPKPMLADGETVARPRKKGEPLDLIAEAKLRLADIDTELERLSGLQRERRRLAAMVAAAEEQDACDPAPVLFVLSGMGGGGGGPACQTTPSTPVVLIKAEPNWTAEQAQEAIGSGG